MGKATKLKKLRRLAERATKHLPFEDYSKRKPRDIAEGLRNKKMPSELGECTKGAYKALKSGKVQVINHEV